MGGARSVEISKQGGLSNAAPGGQIGRDRTLRSPLMLSDAEVKVPTPEVHRQVAVYQTDTLWRPLCLDLKDRALNAGAKHDFGSVVLEEVSQDPLQKRFFRREIDIFHLRPVRVFLDFRLQFHPASFVASRQATIHRSSAIAQVSKGLAPSRKEKYI